MKELGEHRGRYFSRISLAEQHSCLTAWEFGKGNPEGNRKGKRLKEGHCFTKVIIESIK